MTEPTAYEIEEQKLLHRYLNASEIDRWTLDALHSFAYAAVANSSIIERRAWVEKKCNSDFAKLALNSMWRSQRDYRRLQERLHTMEQAVVKATIRHEGCYEGKKGFLEDCGIDLDTIPGVTIRVTMIADVTVPDLGTGTELDNDFVCGLVKDANGIDPTDADNWNFETERF